MRKQKHIKQTQVVKKPEIVEKPFSWWKFSIKILLLLFVVILAVIFTDKKNYWYRRLDLPKI